MVVGPDRALVVLDGLLSGCETKTAVVNRELHEMALLAAQQPRLREEIVEQSGRSLWNHLNDYAEFSERFARFLEDHGHREMDMDYCQPTWSGQPWVVLDSIALMVRQDNLEDPAQTARELRMKYAEAELSFLGSLPDDLRFFFRELIRLARTYTTLDDLEHYETTRVNPVAREAALALGKHLAKAGILDTPEDVFFFGRDDLERLVGNFPPDDPGCYRKKVYDARRSFELAGAATPPWSLGEDEPEEVAVGANTLKGLPGSPGRITAPCFLVREPSDFGRFPPDAVLVARTTNPAWTPLFYNASGLITESGGPLSHGAVTAREMKLPAVMSVRGVMSLLEDGQTVTVDGTRGLVLLEEA
jgi:pyruvate,water dikinase